MIFSLVVLLILLECSDATETQQQQQEPWMAICTLDELISYRADCDKQAKEEPSSCVDISFDLDHCSCFYEMDFDCLVAEKKKSLGNRMCAGIALHEPCAVVRDFDLKTGQCVIEKDHICMLQAKLYDVFDSGVQLLNRLGRD